MPRLHASLLTGYRLAGRDLEQPAGHDPCQKVQGSRNCCVPDLESDSVPQRSGAGDGHVPITSQTPRVAAEKSAAKTAPAKKLPTPIRGFCRQSKTEIVLSLLMRRGGATLHEIMQAIDWKAHSVRGFISGTIGKKMNLTVVSTKNSEGVRHYRLKAEPDEVIPRPNPGDATG